MFGDGIVLVVQMRHRNMKPTSSCQKCLGQVGVFLLVVHIEFKAMFVLERLGLVLVLEFPGSSYVFGVGAIKQRALP